MDLIKSPYDSACVKFIFGLSPQVFNRKFNRAPSNEILVIDVFTRCKNRKGFLILNNFDSLMELFLMGVIFLCDHITVLK